MKKEVSIDVVEKWLKGWSLSRDLQLPLRYKSGFMVNVGEEKQKTRYVFPELNDDFFRSAETIDDPWVFLKVCASYNEFKDRIPEKWIHQPQGYMMSCFAPMNIADVELSSEYKLDFSESNSTVTIRILTENGKLASIGRVVLIDDLAVYDRILTENNHRRKGLATILMKELEKIAISKGVFNNFLVATQQGRLLYESLGWKLYCLYSSIVIPGKNSNK